MNSVYLQKVKHKNLEKKNYCLLASWRTLTKEQDPESDPFVKGTEPRIRIRTKMSRIRNTACTLNWGPPLPIGIRYDPLVQEFRMTPCYRYSLWKYSLNPWSRGLYFMTKGVGRAQHDFSLAWLEAAWYRSESAQARLETGRFKEGFVKCVLLYYPSTEFESTVLLMFTETV